MTQEHQELLLKDLCTRLAYGLRYKVDGYNSHHYILCKISIDTVDNDFPIKKVKPYLFPLSSMTKEQKEEWSYTLSSDYHITYDTIDWLNKNHFDYRGLIEKGLAIDATGLNIY